MVEPKPREGRPLPTELTLQPHVAQWIVQSLARGLATFGLIDGLVIIQGGRIRWSSRIFEGALHLPGAPESWGALLVIFSCLVLTGSLLGRRRIVACGLYLSATWTLCLGAVLFLEALQSGLESRTPGLAYATITFVYIMLGSAYSASRQRGISVGGGR